MSPTVLNSAARLTDALERELVRGGMAQGRTTHLSAGKSLKLKRIARGFSGFLDGLSDTVSRARKQSARFGGANW